MASSKSSQTTRNIVIACLALWSVISLIIIVVWATSPDMKSASQCRAELQTLTEKHEGARVVYAKNKAALEEMVEEGRANQTRQLRETERLLERLGQTNVSLDDCRQENVILGGNITVLEKEIGMHKEIEANLTSEIMLNQEHIEFLQENLTQASHKWESCVALHSAAESRRIAAESQTKACESSKLYLQKQLQRCKKEDHHSFEFLDDGVAAPQTSILALAVVLCVSLHLIT
ncbi:unnamed protein product [Coregonus sp. 'balchen']|uniref:uncharacterized protein si:ch211-1a19.3 n=1 Tax=Coregonus clupeaformis TaxID=59861 RepID=UPI0013E51DD3|nr:uncharacterized protein si:ch211-1a19.3 [Coregonus clupeaformis]CAB1324571.1 unnamed protein product [Coregonus sp. 'balchen']